ncbi:MAG: BlaI/MecI/CopY family transcriptional regulator, partial [Saprospiraceae bacterium]|nr:BlaI/MecI/CopY family transcriptional regulator [Saprospiraceae bacterium]
MKGANLGELEELVLLVVASLFNEAYGISIQSTIEQKCQRTIAISTVHTVLHRLMDKGYLQSHYGGATKTRGG